MPNVPPLRQLCWRRGYEEYRPLALFLCIFRKEYVFFMADIKTANNGVSHQNSVQGQLTGNGQSTWLTPVRKAAHHQQLTAHRERLTGKLLTGKLLTGKGLPPTDHSC
ncbi:MAG: hypothetical protein U0V54_09280 [Saprospiraceae bacterium]